MTEQDILLKYGTHIHLGWCVQVILMTDLRYLRIASIEPQLIPAITLKQIKFNLNERGIPTSFITWAYVSESTLQKLRHNPDYLLHFSEWNEGTNVLIMDIVAPFGDLKRLLLEFSLDMKNDFDYVFYRLKNNRHLIKSTPLLRKNRSGVNRER